MPAYLPARAIYSPTRQDVILAGRHGLRHRKDVAVTFLISVIMQLEIFVVDYQLQKPI